MNFELVHPNRPETHKNSPAPEINPRYVEELTNIGGLNPFGSPNLRFAWGQTRTQFRCGRDRLLYIDERIDAIRHTRHLLKRVLFYDAQGVPQWETRILKAAPRIIPDGWLYEEQLASIEWVGIQCWFIEQWRAPEIRLPDGSIRRLFGTPAEWEKIRYDVWDDPETGYDPYCDRLGPFPSRGRHEAFIQVCRPFSWIDEYDEPVHESFLGDDGLPAVRQVGVRKVRQMVDDVCYRAVDEDYMKIVRAGAYERERRVVESPEKYTARLFEEQAEKEKKLRDERQERARNYFKQDHWRWSSPDAGPTGGVGGGARVYGGIGENHVNTDGAKSA